MSSEYKICSRCVMDTSDPEITFDAKGECNHCQRFDNVLVQDWLPDARGEKKLSKIIEQIRESGKGREYDCIMGLSGGIDSSYLAYEASKMGLRILAVHVDGGWNSELAVKNIESIVRKCGIDLHTHVINWEDMKDLQAAFLRSGVANQDVPQDHAFFAALYTYAVKNDIQWVLHGGNIATESVLPNSWGYSAMDARHLRAIHRQFGTRKLKDFPIVGFFTYHIYYPFIKKMKVARPLNYMPYSKEEALKVLEQEVGFKYYGGKHYESRFTKFFQSYYLPQRFGYDKRRAHLSSLILSGQIGRDEAFEQLKEPPFDAKEIEAEIEFVIKKLGFSRIEFQEIMDSPVKSYRDFANNERIVTLKVKLNKFLIKRNINTKTV